MGSTKSTNGVPAWTMPAPFASENEEEDNAYVAPPVGVVFKILKYSVGKPETLRHQTLARIEREFAHFFN